MKLWKLIILWSDRNQEFHLYESEEEASKVANGYLKAFGHQVAWCGITEVDRFGDVNPN